MPTIRVERPDDNGDEEEDVEREDVIDARYHALVAKPDKMAWTPGHEHGLPDAIRVGARSYEVRVFQPRDSESWDARLGAVDTYDDDGIIWTRWPPDAETRDTLLHEILHAVDHATGTEAGERVVRAWTPVLLDVLRANPELTALLLSDEELRGR